MVKRVGCGDKKIRRCGSSDLPLHPPRNDIHRRALRDGCAVESPAGKGVEDLVHDGRGSLRTRERRPGAIPITSGEPAGSGVRARPGDGGGSVGG